MTNIIDLDALAPKPVTIHIGGKDINVEPPKTINIIRLGSLGQKLQDVSSLSVDEQAQLIQDLTAEIKTCIPELKDIELNTAQLLKLVQIISEMGTPTEAKELQARGITPAGPKAQ